MLDSNLGPTAVLSIQGTVSNLPSGSKSIAAAFDASPVISAVTEVLIQPGGVPIFIPAGATGVFFVPPPGNTVQLTLEGDTHDQGLALSKTLPCFLSLNPGQPWFRLKAPISGFTPFLIEFNWI